MRAKNQTKPTVLRHTVGVSFAEVEVTGKLSFKVYQLVLDGNKTQVQNTSVDVMRDEL